MPAIRSSRARFAGRLDSGISLHRDGTGDWLKAKYRLVKQLDEWGCGVACAASVLGTSYKKAKEALIEIKGDEIDSKPCGLSLRALSKLSPSHRAVYGSAQDFSRWPIGTIAFLSEKSGRYAGSGHYILKTPHGWMDPWANSGNLPRQVKFRAKIPSNTIVQAALIPRAV